MKKNIFIIGLCTAALVLAGASCSKDSEMNELLSNTGSSVTTKTVIRDSLSVVVDTVGTLAEKIGDRASSVQKLTVSGPIDATDVTTIRSLSSLLSLDLKGATICGGDSTYTANNTQYRLYDNIIGQRMFYGTSLSEIVLPDNITEIDSYAFYYLRGTSDNPFSSIVIPEGVTHIRSYAFYSCSNLTTVSLPSSLIEIGDNAFYSCSSLQSITFPESLTTLGHQCFGNSGLLSVDIPENITVFEQSSDLARTFYNCSSLQSVTLPNSMTSTPPGAFEGCNSLSSVTLPENLESISYRTFYDCHSLRNIELPQSLKYIYSYAFYAAGLTSINIPDSVEQIETRAFSNCSALAEVTLSNSLTSLSDNTFRSCSSLNNIEIPSSVTSLGEAVFAQSGLTSIIIPNSVESMGNTCFYYCESLASVTLSNKLTTLPSTTFNGCSKLTSIELPESITTLGRSCFQTCTALESVIILGSVTSIEQYCFSDCTALESISIPGSVTSIGDNCFDGCTTLKSIVIPNSVTSIGRYCFSGCTALSDITLSEKLESIGSDCFLNCDNLTSITIPESVTSAGTYMFNGCENLTSIFWNTSTAVPNPLFTGLSNSSGVIYKNPYVLLYLANGSTQVNDTYIQNIIIDGVAEEIVLSSSYGNFFVPQAFRANKVTYTREFTYPTYPGEASGWRSISLPFTVETITGPDGQTLAPFNADVPDAKPFWLRRLTENGFEDVTEIEANVPYIIAMPNNEAYDDEYNISGTVTFTAEGYQSILFEDSVSLTQDVGPRFAFNCNFSYIPANTTVYALNESTSSGYAGSVFVRNERAVMPFEGYVSSSSVTRAPAYYEIFESSASTRSKRPLGRVPQIDDM